MWGKYMRATLGQKIYDFPQERKNEGADCRSILRDALRKDAFSVEEGRNGCEGFDFICYDGKDLGEINDSSATVYIGRKKCADLDKFVSEFEF